MEDVSYLTCIPGLIIYFAYGYRNSKAGKKHWSHQSNMFQQKLGQNGSWWTYLQQQQEPITIARCPSYNKKHKLHSVVDLGLVGRGKAEKRPSDDPNRDKTLWSSLGRGYV